LDRIIRKEDKRRVTLWASNRQEFFVRKVIILHSEDKIKNVILLEKNTSSKIYNREKSHEICRRKD